LPLATKRESKLPSSELQESRAVPLVVGEDGAGGNPDADMESAGAEEIGSVTKETGGADKGSAAEKLPLAGARDGAADSLGPTVV
jgi:hypothetical protein